MKKSKEFKFEDCTKEINIGDKVFVVNTSRKLSNDESEIFSIGNKFVQIGTSKNRLEKYYFDGVQETNMSRNLVYSSKEAYETITREQAIINKVYERFSWSNPKKITLKQAVEISKILECDGE